MSLFYCYQHLKSKPLICLNVYTEVTNNIKGNMTDVGTDKIKPFLANYIFKWTFIFKPILLHLSQSPQRQGKQEEKREWERSEEREQRKAVRSDEDWQKGGQEWTWENNTLYKEDSDIYFFFSQKDVRENTEPQSIISLLPPQEIHFCWLSFLFTIYPCWLRSAHLSLTSRVLFCFLYFPQVRDTWKDENHRHSSTLLYILVCKASLYFFLWNWIRSSPLSRIFLDEELSFCTSSLTFIQSICAR